VDGYGLWIALGAGVLSGFFAAINHALLHVSRGRLQDELRRRGKEHRFVLLEHSDDMIMLTAVFRAALNISILLMAILWFDPMSGPQPWLSMGWAFVVAGAIIAVMGVAIPLSFGRHAAEPLLARTLPLLRLLHVLFSPVLMVLHWFDPVIRRLVGVDEHENEEYSQEIIDAVTEGEKSGLVDETQKEMIEAVVEFPTTTVDQIMTPRTDVTGIEVARNIDQVKAIIAEAGHSRYPVYEGDLDHIVGVLYAKDLLSRVGLPDEEPFDLRTVVRPALFVPESKTVRDLLQEFQAKKVHLALVLDEYGGTAGLVSIEDIIEEIVGEIQDEYEPENRAEPTIHQVDAGVAEVDARVHIDDLNDELNIALPEDEDYDTVGGFVFSTLGHIPEVGESFDFQNVRITVTDAAKNKVNRVKIVILSGTAGLSANGSAANHNG
jgi:CBS domain containing-hemolysin-like protein